MKTNLQVETLVGSVCSVEVDVVGIRCKENILIKSWDSYKELRLIKNGKLFWVVENEFNKIPEDWKEFLVEGEKT